MQAALAAIGVAGSIGSALVLASHISITAQPPLRSFDLLSTPFTVQDDGFLPLTGVRFVCQVDSIETTSGQEVLNNRTVDRLLFEVMTRGDARDWGCGRPSWTGNIVGSVGHQQIVRVTVEIRYRVCYFPHTVRFAAGFRSAPTADATLRFVRADPLPIWEPGH